MPRYELTQRRKAEKNLQGRWELPAGSRVWCYLRHSPGDNQTIDSQKSGMISWCAASGQIIERFFIDEAIEGSREDRAQFQLMISLARQQDKQVDGIAVWSFSRFARSQLDAQFYKADLRKRGYVIVSKVDEIPNNEMAPLIEAFIDWKNQQFLEDLSADVKRGLSHSVEQGYWPGGHAPIGYRNEKINIGRRRNGEPRYANRLLKDDQVSDRVALAWKMKIEDNASYLTIHEATHLYSDSKHYSDFFDNLIYTGIFVYHGQRYPLNWEEQGRFCEAYITLEEYFQVQMNRQRRLPHVIHPRSLSSPYLLTGLLYCGVCAARGASTSLVGQTDKRRPDTRLYRCATKIRSRGTDCLLPRIPCWKLDEMVINVLKQTVLTTEYVRAEVNQANELLSKTDSDVEPQLQEASRFAKEQQKRVESIVELIGKKGVTAILEMQYDAANKAWLEAISRVESLKSKAQRGEQQYISLNEAYKYLDEMLVTLAGDNEREKQALISRFVERLDVFPERVDVKLRFSSNNPLLRLDGSNSEPQKYEAPISEPLTGLWSVSPRRLERRSMASEATALSSELWGREARVCAIC